MSGRSNVLPPGGHPHRSLWVLLIRDPGSGQRPAPPERDAASHPGNVGGTDASVRRQLAASERVTPSHFVVNGGPKLHQGGSSSARGSLACGPGNTPTCLNSKSIQLSNRSLGGLEGSRFCRPERSENGNSLLRARELGLRFLEERQHSRVEVLAAADVDLVVHSTTCPHRLGPLDGCEVVDGLITCPWHGYRFDVRTGESADGHKLRLAAAPRLAVDPETGRVRLESASSKPGGGPEAAYAQARFP